VFGHDLLRFESRLKGLIEKLEGSATLPLMGVTIVVTVNKRGKFEWRVLVDNEYAAQFDTTGKRSWTLDVTLVNDLSYLSGINKQLSALGQAFRQ
jgi:hypothetical protein